MERRLLVQVVLSVLWASMDFGFSTAFATLWSLLADALTQEASREDNFLVGSCWEIDGCCDLEVDLEDPGVLSDSN